MSNKFYDGIHKNPIIAAVNSNTDLNKVIDSACEIVFLLNSTIFELKHVVKSLKDAGKAVYIHVDLMDGFSKDIIALKYILKEIVPDGIITTKGYLIKAAKEQGVFAIQRLFLLDSLNLETGINSIKSNKPDAVEILPGVMPKITELIVERTKAPIITGGLIMDKEDVMSSLKAGAVAISTSNEEIWKL